jgi:hypothetical protein
MFDFEDDTNIRGSDVILDTGKRSLSKVSERWLVSPKKSVYPSGRDLPTKEAAVEPPAPGLFSTKTGTLLKSDIL